jgi:hypothetical protein
MTVTEHAETVSQDVLRPRRVSIRDEATANLEAPTPWFTCPQLEQVFVVHSSPICGNAAVVTSVQTWSAAQYTSKHCQTSKQETSKQTNAPRSPDSRTGPPSGREGSGTLRSRCPVVAMSFEKDKTGRVIMRSLSRSVPPLLRQRKLPDPTTHFAAPLVVFAATVAAVLAAAQHPRHSLSAVMQTSLTIYVAAASDEDASDTACFLNFVQLKVARGPLLLLSL